MRRLEGGFALGGLEVPARPGLTEVALAALMLLILIFRPAGIMAGREVPVPGWLSGRTRP